MNCIYTNVDLGGKIRMDGTVSDNDLIFIGKDGNNSFRICVNSHTLKGHAQDGDKRLQVSLSHNKMIARILCSRVHLGCKEHGYTI